MESTGTLKLPSKNKKRMREDMYSKLSEDEKKAIRHTVHTFYKKNEIPTVDKVIQIIKENELIRHMSRSTLLKVLKKLGFVWEKIDGNNSMLVDREDIILWRRNYLDKIFKYRQEGRVIYYLDEMWVNAGRTIQKVCKDETGKNAREALVEELSAELKDSSDSDNGNRLITHIGSENGFVEGGLLFQSKDENMNAAVFEKWLTKILPSLAEKSVIVLDNAPHHSIKLEKTPTDYWRKMDIEAYLLEKGVEISKDLLKIELVDIAKNYVRTHPVPYRVDEIVGKGNREVLRLPPYHCKLNLIELVWVQVKEFVAANNTTYKMSDVRNLFDEGLKQITAEKWASCVDQVKKEEKDLYELDDIIENMQQQFLVNTASSEDLEFCDFD